MHIAVIGLGEVGRCYAGALAQRGGVQLALCDPAPSDAARDLAASLGLPINPDPGPWLAECDLVFACVVGTAALAVANTSLPRMRAGEGLYADFTTADPQAMREAGRMASGRGIAFVDAAIMGAIALTGASTALLAAGDATPEWRELMTSLGARVTVLPDAPPGDAVSLKLLRSAFTKGLEAIVVEVLTEAERRGVREAFYEVISDIDEGSLPRYLETLIQTHVVHARRRRREVTEVRRQFDASGVPSDVLPAVESAFARTVAALESWPPEEQAPSFQAALHWLMTLRANCLLR